MYACMYVCIVLHHRGLGLPQRERWPYSSLKTRSMPYLSVILFLCLRLRTSLSDSLVLFNEVIPRPEAQHLVVPWIVRKPLQLSKRDLILGIAHSHPYYTSNSSIVCTALYMLHAACRAPYCTARQFEPMREHCRCLCDRGNNQLWQIYSYDLYSHGLCSYGRCSM